MTRAEFLTYIRNKLHTLSSGVGSSYEDEELYDFIDRAQLIVLNQQIAKNNSAYLSELLVSDSLDFFVSELTSTSLFKANNESQYPVYVNISDLSESFYAFVYGSISVTRPNDGFNTISSSEPVALEEIPITAIDKFRISTVNQPYFINPKVVFNYSGDKILIIPDYYTDFGIPKLLITYVKKPLKFADMADDREEPVISEALHLDIADKAADLAKTPLDAQITYSEVRTDEEIKKSDS